MSSAATVMSDSKVLCTAPAFVGSGSGLEPNNGGGFVVVDIATSTKGHRAASQGLVFWYRPIPTLDSFSPSVGRVGGGTTVVVTGSGPGKPNFMIFNAEGKTVYDAGKDANTQKHPTDLDASKLKFSDEQKAKFET